MTETPTVAELLDITRQLTERVAVLEAENKALREENTRLKKHISELERKKTSTSLLTAVRSAKLIPKDPDAKLYRGTSPTNRLRAS